MTPLMQALLDAGERRALEALRGLRSDDPAQQLVLRAVVDLVERYGPEGVDMVALQLERLLSGRSSVDIDFSDLQIASDLLALQVRASWEDRTAVGDALARISAALGPVLAGILRSAL